ncbi:hypothetical protein FOB64_006478 [Candida albicans]|uniref:F-box domain-containing protein n=1 Tax=Candida albicans TaxID=5476 RepID=A0A8H6F011_CANAX|nr:hypothetical protein FOB64_006478 [Candida albicans]
MLKLYKNFTITVKETDYSDENGNSDEELYYGSQDSDDGFDEDYDFDDNFGLTIAVIMASEETDIKLFTRLGQLPDDVIALIISYVPKCQLQPLLGFSPTKRHCCVFEKSSIACEAMESLSKTLYFSSFKELGAMLDVFPEVVINAEGINGVFDKEGSGNRVQNIKQLTRYDLKYDRLELKDFEDTFLVAKAVTW